MLLLHSHIMLSSTLSSPSIPSKWSTSESVESAWLTLAFNMTSDFVNSGTQASRIFCATILIRPYPNQFARSSTMRFPVSENIGWQWGTIGKLIDNSNSDFVILIKFVKRICLPILFKCLCTKIRPVRLQSHPSLLYHEMKKPSEKTSECRLIIFQSSMMRAKVRRKLYSYRRSSTSGSYTAIKSLKWPNQRTHLAEFIRLFAKRHELNCPIRWCLLLRKGKTVWWR